jgi:hypothetical protein
MVESHGGKEVTRVTDTIISLLRTFALRHDYRRVSDVMEALVAFPQNRIVALIEALADQDCARPWHHIPEIVSAPAFPCS